MVGVRRLPLAPLRAPFEQHVERGQEQQDPARDTKGGHRDADEAQDSLARQTEKQQDQRGDKAGAQRHGAAALGIHPAGQRDEHRHQTGRVDDHEEGSEGGDQKT